MQPSSEITGLLLRWNEGDEQACNQLMPLLYDELRQLARARIRNERADHTLGTTGLVHEAYLRLVDLDQARWNDRVHFMALASRIMKNLLVDYANRRRSQKRGGGRQHVPVVDDLLISDEQAEAVLELDDALTRLEAQHGRPAQAIIFCYFGGLTNEEAAEALGISRATIERDLRFARAWLGKAMGRADVPFRRA